MPDILALDTATEACSVALYLKGELHEQFELAPRRHNQRILPMVESILAEAGVSLNQLDGIAFGRGPGAFTGVRIATGIAQGLAFASELPVVPVSNLAALALQARRDQGIEQIMTAVDARKDEVYWCCYGFEGEKLQELLPERVCAPEDVTLPEGFDASAATGIGTGWIFADRLPCKPQQIIENALPRAGDMAMLAVDAWNKGVRLAPENALPVYLRDNVADTIAEREKAKQAKG
ncbi:tRNA (adenosine(37)-N6)-threonylcarbamoyltransferase complex dimerization subunit type 1 TsaB [Endozoicomonadaceae bacterium StTr2]